MDDRAISFLSSRDDFENLNRRAMMGFRFGL